MDLRVADLSRYLDFTDWALKETLQECRNPGEDEKEQARRMASEIAFALRLLGRLNLEEWVMGLDKANLYIEVHGAYSLRRLEANEQPVVEYLVSDRSPGSSR